MLLLASPIIRPCTATDTPTILEIINEAAVAYRDVIPSDCWHMPYMTRESLDRDIALGVSFIGMESDGHLVGVMGRQTVGDVDLIRHAYVASAFQRHGVGGALLRHVLQRADSQFLVGTWANASWAIAFYERHGFTPVDTVRKDMLLRRYWNVPARQMDVSVVLARPALMS